MTDSGAVKVLDYGIARLKERARPELETHAGTTMGTVGFMPPEQALGFTDEVDARSDVWAIGATLYALLTGRTVHVGQTQNEALMLAMTTPVRPMAQLLPSLPPDVRALLDRALEFEQRDRFPSAKAMKIALDSALAALGSTTVEPEPLSPPRPEHVTSLMPSQPSETLLARIFARRGTNSSIHPPSSDSQRKTRLITAICGLVMMAAFGGVVAGFVSARRDRAVATQSLLPPGAGVTASHPNHAVSTLAPSSASLPSSSASGASSVASASSAIAASPMAALLSSPKSSPAPPATAIPPAGSASKEVLPSSGAAPRRGSAPLALPSSRVVSTMTKSSPSEGAAPTQDTRDPLGVRHT